MAVFESQISAQVTQAQKDEIGAVLDTDQEVYPGTSEADVLRAALELGLPLLADVPAGRRREMYALQRRGLRIGASARE